MSREVAENFGKKHDNVKRDLDKIISEEPSLVSQIILSSITACFQMSNDNQQKMKR